MVNTAAQGRLFEHEIIHYLAGCSCETTHVRPTHVGWRGFGYVTMRSAASKGAIDIVALAPHTASEWRDGTLLFIQAKRTNAVLPPAERTRVQELASWVRAVPLVAFRALDEKTGRVRPHFRLLTGPGPKDFTLWNPGEDDR